MNKDNKTNLTIEQALELHKDLYRPDYRGHHQRAIVCLGLDRWLDCADTALREGRDPARYFSHLIQKEWQVYNYQKQAHKDQTIE